MLLNKVKMKPKLGGVVVILLLTSTLSLANLYWLKLDTRPQQVIDEYVEKTLNLADGMVSHRLIDYPRLFYWATIGPRPSLYQVMAAPFIIFFERSADSMLIVNAIFLIVLGIATYKVAELSMGVRAGILASLIVVTYPIVVQLTKIARPYAILPAAIALVFWVMLMVMKKRTVIMTWLLAGSIFFAFCIHAFSLYLLFGPSLLLAAYTIFFQTKPSAPRSLREGGSWGWEKLRDPYVFLGFLPSMTMLIALIATWLFVKWEQVVNLKNAASEFADQYGFWFYEQTMHLHVSIFFTILFIGSCFVLIVASVKRPKEHIYTLFLIVSLVLMLAGARSLEGSKSWHMVSGVLPVMAVLTSLGTLRILNSINSIKQISSIGNIVKTLAFSAILIFASLNYFITGWGLPKSYLLMRFAGVNPECRSRNVFCPNPPVAGDWKIQAILRQVVGDPKCRKSTCSISLLSHRAFYFSDEAFTYSMVQYYPQETLKASNHFYPERTFRIHRIGRGKGGMLNWLMADYCVFLISSTGQPKKEPEHNYGRWAKLEYPVVRFFLDSVEKKDSPYDIIYNGKLPNGLEVILVRKTRKISFEEARAILDSLNISDKDKNELHEAFLKIAPDEWSG